MDTKTKRHRLGAMTARINLVFAGVTSLETVMPLLARSGTVDFAKTLSLNASSVYATATIELGNWTATGS